ncbi:lysine N(6)-hydroxylase/L-ornithine N(5)-oxygenase family protein [Flexibacterium corallicola]|uniref:lysine N(6)-hydroxylase/L-ornithine N(5)-oxygenase family protein n=1 Tax=Flexibacterium corallicola TaxID=3037259 RepID=UPI00286EFC3B|nr:SidA/IucD/PvdA family monooxygenase [Pseudovibrio sp. M1P-2-3]
MSQLKMIGHQDDASDLLDLAGIGIGPFNLSLAALLDSLPNTRAGFYDKNSQFAWHPGLLFPDSILQTSFLKDLVTPVQPTNPHSFTNFLVSHKRFYDFLAGRFTGVSRLEFNAYLAWAAQRIDSLNWDHQAQSISFKDSAFTVDFGNGKNVRARNLSLGIGMSANIPAWAQTHMGTSCIHAGHYLNHKLETAGKRIAVIGGGQTGAEIVLDLLSNPSVEPHHVSWISNLPRFSPLEEGGFVDQVFTPNYVESYQSMGPEQQAFEFAGQKLASDGLTPVTVDALYKEIYKRTHLVSQKGGISLLPSRNAVALSHNGSHYDLVCQQIIGDVKESHSVDIIILATGASPKLPQFLEDLKPRLDLDERGLPKLDDAYEIQWDGPSQNKIFGLNMGLRSHGIVDPQMSLMAWRSAKIINRLMDKEIFETTAGHSLVDWSPQINSNANYGETSCLAS